jgi:hypothetical protein
MKRPFENCEDAFIYYNPSQYSTLNVKDKRLFANSSSNLNSLIKSCSEQQMSNSATANSDNTSSSSSNSPNAPNMESTLQVRSSSAFKSQQQEESEDDSSKAATWSKSQTDEGENNLTRISTSSSSSSSASSLSMSKSTGQKEDTSLTCENKVVSSEMTKSDDKNRLSLNSVSSSGKHSSYCCSTSSTSNLSHMTNSSLNENELLNNLKSTNTNSSVQKSKVQLEVELLLNDLLEKLSKSESHQASLNLLNSRKTNNQKTILTNLFVRLQISLDELRALYIELNDLQEHFQFIESLFLKLFNISRVSDKELLVGGSRHRENDSTSLSIMLDDVLQYFDFLNSENSDSDDSTANKAENRPENAAMIHRKLSTDSDSSCSSGLSDDCSVGYFDLDLLIIFHLQNLIALLDVRFFCFYLLFYVLYRYFECDF